MNDHHHHQKSRISGQNIMVMLTLLGYSRDHKTCNQLIQEKKSLLPNDIIRYISKFIVYDIRSNSYKIYCEMMKKKEIMKCIAKEMVSYTKRSYCNPNPNMWFVIYPTNRHQFTVLYGVHCSQCGQYEDIYNNNYQQRLRCFCS
jgi:hypothetical protein